MPSCWKVRATEPSGRTTLVAVKKIRMARGMMIITMARNWRARNAWAPSWTASAISFILAVPWSKERTFRARSSPETMPTMPANRQMYNHVLSTPPRWKAW